MKILATGYNIFNFDNGIAPQKNGGSIMIADICEYLGRYNDMYFFITDKIVKEKRYGTIKILDNTYGFEEYPEYRRVKDGDQRLLCGFDHVIESINPDFVLVQTLNQFALDVIDYLEEARIKYAYVSHLFIGKNKYYSDSFSEKFEDSLYKKNDLKIITVGNGMRKRLLSEYSNIREENIYTVVNGTKIDNNSQQEPCFFNNDKRILICSGSIQPRKNQMQLIRSIALLEKEILENLRVIIIGVGSQERIDSLNNEIIENGLENVVEYHEPLEAKDMSKIYSIADGLVLPSLCEGVSLVILEALRFGKPVIMFEDNETAEDVNNEDAVILVDDHSDTGLADGIRRWYYKEWDEKRIKTYSDYFTMERVAKDYNKIIYQLVES